MTNEYRARDLFTADKIVDAAAPPVVFVGLNGWLGLQAAAVGALGLAVALVGVRLGRGQRPLYAFSGLAGVLIGVGTALWSGDAAGFFLPGIVINAVMGVASVVSILVKRPLVALFSAAIYRWPLGWYWQDRVRPAYSEITWAWAALYLSRAALLGALVAREAVGWLAVARILTGWPAFAILVIATYAYVNWRLARLGAPTVQEWEARNSEPAPIA
ncbi:MAG: DUF3159 domain-containing protein [Egibacteraceae bacterium]